MLPGRGGSETDCVGYLRFNFKVWGMKSGSTMSLPIDECCGFCAGGGGREKHTTKRDSIIKPGHKYTKERLATKLGNGFVSTDKDCD